MKVKITGNPITAMYGALEPGDILECGDDFARHLVDDCKCAEYIESEIKQDDKETKKQPRKSDSKPK